MKIAKLGTLTLCFTVLSATAGHADASSPASKKQSAHISASAEALSKAMLPEDQFKQMVDAIVQTGYGAAKSKIETEKLTIDMDKKGKELEKSLRSTFTYSYFIGLNSATMTKNFSEDELKKILAFYNTEVGKKWIKNTPEIISETMTQIQMDLQEKLPKLVNAMVQK